MTFLVYLKGFDPVTWRENKEALGWIQRQRKADARRVAKRIFAMKCGPAKLIDVEAPIVNMEIAREIARLPRLRGTHK